MSYTRVHAYNSGVLNAAQPGDIVSLAELVTVINNAAAQTLSAAALSGQIILRQNAGVVSDVTDTAVNIMQACYGNTGSAPKVGEGFMCWYSNQGASTVTITGGTGVTVSGNTAVLTLTMKQLVFICTAAGTSTYANGVYTNVGATFNCYCL
jgi:hypothetical protein